MKRFKVSIVIIEEKKRKERGETLFIVELLFVAIILFLIYSILPTLFIRLSSLRIVKKGVGEKKISLTFDDGPHPQYTKNLLDLLKRHNVKATFFVVGEHALKHPHLLRRMVIEGHEIGIHHYKHKSGWFLTPGKLKKELKMCQEAIEHITGREVRYYRPPWGHFNICTLALAKTYQIIMWSVILQDWKIEKGESTLSKRLIEGLCDGHIYLLHDNGSTFGAEKQAPRIMIEQLSLFLDEMHKRNFTCVSLQDLIVGKKHYRIGH